MKAKGGESIPILTIAGSDCNGGAGVQADLKTLSAYKLLGMNVTLSVVTESIARVISVHNVPVKRVEEQFLTVFEDIPPEAAKIGMIGSKELMFYVRESLERSKPENVVIDPVMFAKNGFALMPSECYEFFKENILQFIDILTPSISEAQFLSGSKIQNEEEMIKATKYFHAEGAKAVLIEGGHSEINANDVFFGREQIHTLKGERIETKNTHDTGCTLSSAIALSLALGKTEPESVRGAKGYVRGAIDCSLNLGKGCGPTNHLWVFNA